jgi:hypothetical protein
MANSRAHKEERTLGSTIKAGYDLLKSGPDGEKSKLGKMIGDAPGQAFKAISAKIRLGNSQAAVDAHKWENK